MFKKSPFSPFFGENDNANPPSLQRQLMFECQRVVRLFQRTNRIGHRSIRDARIMMDAHFDPLGVGFAAPETDAQTKQAHQPGFGNEAAGRHRQHFHSSYTAMRGQGRLLQLLAKSDGIQMKDIVETFDIRPSSASELVAKLQKRDLVRTEIDGEDKRARRVFITEKGRAFIDQFNALHHDKESSILDALSEEEQKTLLALLQKMTARLGKHPEAQRPEAGCAVDSVASATPPAETDMPAAPIAAAEPASNLDSSTSASAKAETESNS